MIFIDNRWAIQTGYLLKPNSYMSFHRFICVKLKRQ